MEIPIEILLEKIALLENEIDKLKKENIEIKKEIKVLKGQTLFRSRFSIGSMDKNSLGSIDENSLEDSEEVPYDDPFDKNPLNTYNPFKRDYRVNPPSFDGDGPFC